MVSPSIPDLEAVLERINRARAAGEERAAEEGEVEAAFAASGKLAVYGSLAPGRANHHVVRPLGGSWSRGTVRGHLHPSGWGAGLGYPGFVWNPGAPEVAVELLEADGLPSAWPRIDAFEGPDYVRILVPVEVEGGARTAANLYAIRGGGGGAGAGVPTLRRRS